MCKSLKISRCNIFLQLILFIDRNCLFSFCRNDMRRLPQQFVIVLRKIMVRRVLKLSPTVHPMRIKETHWSWFFLLHLAAPCNRLRFLWTTHKMVPESKIFPSSSWLNEVVVRLTESTPAFPAHLRCLFPIFLFLRRVL